MRHLVCREWNTNYSPRVPKRAPEINLKYWRTTNVVIQPLVSHSSCVVLRRFGFWPGQQLSLNDDFPRFLSSLKGRTKILGVVPFILSPREVYLWDRNVASTGTSWDTHRAEGHNKRDTVSVLLSLKYLLLHPFQYDFQFHSTLFMKTAALNKS